MNYPFTPDKDLECSFCHGTIKKDGWAISQGEDICCSSCYDKTDCIESATYTGLNVRMNDGEDPETDEEALWRFHQSNLID